MSCFSLAEVEVGVEAEAEATVSTEGAENGSQGGGASSFCAAPAAAECA